MDPSFDLIACHKYHKGQILKENIWWIILLVLLVIVGSAIAVLLR